MPKTRKPPLTRQRSFSDITDIEQAQARLGDSVWVGNPLFGKKPIRLGDAGQDSVPQAGAEVDAEAETKASEPASSHRSEAPRQLRVSTMQNRPRALSDTATSERRALEEGEEALQQMLDEITPIMVEEFKAEPTRETSALSLCGGDGGGGSGVKTPERSALFTEEEKPSSPQVQDIILRHTHHLRKIVEKLGIFDQKDALRVLQKLLAKVAEAHGPDIAQRVEALLNVLFIKLVLERKQLDASSRPLRRAQSTRYSETYFGRRVAGVQALSIHVPVAHEREGQASTTPADSALTSITDLVALPPAGAPTIEVVETAVAAPPQRRGWSLWGCCRHPDPDAATAPGPIPTPAPVTTAPPTPV